MNNVRMFPRTMNEAFPNTYEYSCAIERPYYEPKKTWARVAIAAVVIGAVSMVVRAATQYFF
jgi:hypothetical protein